MMQMYKAAIQQEEQNTPAFVRLQQQAEAKEEEARAEKQRRWEEQVASKKFWVSCAVCLVVTPVLVQHLSLRKGVGTDIGCMYIVHGAWVKKQSRTWFL